MFATLAFVIALASPAPLATVDPCSIILADAPNLDGLAADMGAECTRDRAAAELAAGHVEQSSIELARPTWAFAEPRTTVELDAELALVGSRLNPFAMDDMADPFTAGR